MFSIILILILILYSNLFKFNINSEILVSIFSTAIPIKPKRTRGYMPKEEKIRVSNNTPDWFKEIVCGIMLSDGSIRMNGNQALMSIQQTHQELAEPKKWLRMAKRCLAAICRHLVLSGIHII